MGAWYKACEREWEWKWEGEGEEESKGKESEISLIIKLNNAIAMEQAFLSLFLATISMGT